MRPSILLRGVMSLLALTLSSSLTLGHDTEGRTSTSLAKPTVAAPPIAWIAGHDVSFRSRPASMTCSAQPALSIDAADRCTALGKGFECFECCYTDCMRTDDNIEKCSNRCMGRCF